jgi:hypothetical protein
MKSTQPYQASLAAVILASFSLMLAACSVSPMRTSISAPTGVVAGSVTIDGTATRLRYVYARGHAASHVDIERLGLHHGETIENGVISVLLSNTPVSAELANDIVGDAATIPANLIGILMTIDPSRENHWESQFLVNSERVSLFGYTTTGGEHPVVEDGRIKAKLALTNQDAIHRRTFLFAFDSPLLWVGEDWDADVLAYDQAPCGSALYFDAYKKAMPGRWATESWHGESGIPTNGMLTVNEKVGEEQFLGTFHFIVESETAEFDEEVVIECLDSRIHIRGAVVPETRWAADTMDFDLDGSRLVGTGKDEAGRSLKVVLKKIR